VISISPFVCKPHRLFKAVGHDLYLEVADHSLRGRAWRDIRSAQPGRSLDVDVKPGKRGVGRPCAWPAKACRKEKQGSEPILRASKSPPLPRSAIGHAKSSYQSLRKLSTFQPRFTIFKTVNKETKAMAEEISSDTDARPQPIGFDELLDASAAGSQTTSSSLSRSCVSSPWNRLSTWTFHGPHASASGPPAAPLREREFRPQRPGMGLGADLSQRMEVSTRAGLRKKLESLLLDLRNLLH